jgi:hypothetical protein
LVVLEEEERMVDQAVAMEERRPGGGVSVGWMDGWVDGWMDELRQ